MNVFTLFGELKADTRNFEAALIRADKEIKDTEKNLERLERKAKTFGQTSAVTARSHEKFGETLRATKQRMNDAVQAFDAGQISHRKMATVLTQTDSKMAALNARFRDSEARYRDAATGLQGLGSAFAVAGAAASLFTIKATAEFQSLKNQLTAATGSVDGAKQKLIELKQLSLASVGVDVNSAAFAFAQLKANTMLTDEAISKLIRSFGLLKTANPVMDLQQYMRNLQQLFNQGFEGQDFKEAIGNNARFAAQLKAAFGTDNPEVLRAMKDSGKLSAEAWYNGLADATLNDEKINKLTEQPISRIQKAWANLKIDLGQFGDTLTQDLEKEINKATKAMGERDLAGFMEALGEAVGRKFVEGFSSGVSDPAAMLKGIAGALTGFSRGVIQSIINGFDMGAVSAFLGKIANVLTMASRIAISGSLALLSGLQAAWSSGLGRLATLLFTGGLQAMAGLIRGIGSKLGELKAMAAEVAQTVADVITGKWIIQSPSKLFFGIGQNATQGLINGIVSLKDQAGEAMVSLIDLSKIKGKANQAGLELAESLRKEVARLGVTTKLGEVTLDLQDKKYAQLDERVKAYIKTQAREIDAYKYRNEYIQMGVDELSKLVDMLQDSEIETVKVTDAMNSMALKFAVANEKLSPLKKGLNDTILALAQLNVLAQNTTFAGAERADLSGNFTSDGLSGLSVDTPLAEEVSLPPKVKADWVDFWDTLERRMRQFQTSLPTFKTVLGENLTASIQGIGDVFANAVSQWDGTAQGFFKSLAQGFKAMVSQIVSELVRLLVVQAIMKAVGAFAGGIGGGAGGWGAGGAMEGFMIPGAADGGMIQGRGTSTSDSILARLSNGEFVIKAKAVQHWGRDFFENLNSNLSMTPAFAGGGFVGGGSIVNNNQRSASNVFHINVSGGGNPQQTGKQIAREAMLALKREEMRNK